MITVDDKRVFWKTVLACLIRFHQLSYSAASKIVESAKGRLDNGDDLVYHAEPFDVACDLVDKRLDIIGNREVYDQIIAEQH